MIRIEQLIAKRFNDLWFNISFLVEESIGGERFVSSAEHLSFEVYTSSHLELAISLLISLGELVEVDWDRTLFDAGDHVSIFDGLAEPFDLR